MARIAANRANCEEVAIWKEPRMSKRLPAGLDEQVLSHVSSVPNGLPIETISRLFGGDISRRSLQRRLSHLVATGRLRSEKKGRATIYVIPALVAEPSREEGSIALSPSAVEVSRKVRRPLTDRPPVGYN